MNLRKFLWISSPDEIKVILFYNSLESVFQSSRQDSAGSPSHKVVRAAQNSVSILNKKQNDGIPLTNVSPKFVEAWMAKILKDCECKLNLLSNSFEYSRRFNEASEPAANDKVSY